MTHVNEKCQAFVLVTKTNKTMIKKEKHTKKQNLDKSVKNTTQIELTPYKRKSYKKEILCQNSKR